MKDFARAIIINENKILLMQSNIGGNIFYSLVGGLIEEAETPEETLRREVEEETGLNVVLSTLVFHQDLPDEYGKQLIYLCDVEVYHDVSIQKHSEEAIANRDGFDFETPEWVTLSSFESIAFKTPQLQSAIMRAVKHGFPDEPLEI